MRPVAKRAIVFTQQLRQVFMIYVTYRMLAMVLNTVARKHERRKKPLGLSVALDKLKM